MDVAPTEETTLLTKHEAADKLRVSVRTIDRYIQSGDLPPVRLSIRATRVRQSDVDAFLARSSSEAVAS